MQTILVVEDEQDLLDLIEYTLQKEGYDVICCLDTSNVQALLDEEDVSLLLMDRNLGGIEGSLYVKELQQKGYFVPVIYITAKDKNEDIIEGFERGCDDYITKPFNLDVLKARVKALVKRTSSEIEQLKVRDISYNASNKKFFINKKELDLTYLEHNLLLEFMRNKNILLSRDILIENVWSNCNNIKSKTVNVAIKRLKQKIDPTGEKKYIKALRSEGYIFA